MTYTCIYSVEIKSWQEHKNYHSCKTCHCQAVRAVFRGGGVKGREGANNCQCYMYPRLETLYNVWKKLKYKSNLNNVNMNNLLSADQCSNVASTFRQIGKHNHCMPRLGTRTPPSPLKDWKTFEETRQKQKKRQEREKQLYNIYSFNYYIMIIHAFNIYIREIVPTF